MPDKDTLNILTILDSIDKINEYTKNYSDADEFHANQRDFDAAMMNFIIIGEMVVLLSDEFIDEHKNLEWLKIRGFRNIVAHNYFGIDAEEVWEIIKKDLVVLEKELRHKKRSSQ